MSDLYCSVCGEAIPVGMTHLSVSVARERFTDANVLQVQGMAYLEFSCHEECVPKDVTIDLSNRQGPFRHQSSAKWGVEALPVPLVPSDPLCSRCRPR